MRCASGELDCGLRTLEDVPGVMASGSKLVVWDLLRVASRV